MVRVRTGRPNAVVVRTSVRRKGYVSTSFNMVSSQSAEVIGTSVLTIAKISPLVRICNNARFCAVPFRSITKTPHPNVGGVSTEKRARKNSIQSDEAFLMLALPIFPGSHPPSIVGACELNFCVRDGNRWTLTAINTNSYGWLFTIVYCQKPLGF